MFQKNQEQHCLTSCAVRLLINRCMVGEVPFVTSQSDNFLQSCTSLDSFCKGEQVEGVKDGYWTDNFLTFTVVTVTEESKPDMHRHWHV